MSTISIFSYLIIFTVFFLNVFKQIKGTSALSMLTFGTLSIFLSFMYFSNIHEHYMFFVLMSLLFVTYYNIFLFRPVKMEAASLFLNAGQILLPIYLIVETNTLWGKAIAIAFLESLRLIALVGDNSRSSSYSLLNLVNINFKMFLVLISMFSLFLLTGQSVIDPEMRISTKLSLIPILFFYIITFVYLGGINSQIVEKINLRLYKSKNYLAYSYIYQFLIPFSFLYILKETLRVISFNIFEEAVIYILVSSVVIMLTILYNFWRSYTWTYKVQMIKSLVFLPFVILYIFSDKFSHKEFIIIGSIIILCLNVLLTSYHYKVKYKNSILILFSFLLFLTPLSPLFYIFVNKLSSVDVPFKAFVTFLIYFVVIIINYIFHNLVSFKKERVNRINKYATHRMLYLGVGILISFIVIGYDKI